jgi:hypothetical protein
LFEIEKITLLNSSTVQSGNSRSLFHLEVELTLSIAPDIGDRRTDLMGKLKFYIILTALSIFSSGCSENDNSLDPSIPVFTSIGGQISGVLPLSNSPYRITQTLLVDAADTLLIEPGVRLYFNDSTGLVIYGQLLCTGTASQQILFTAASTSWKGIRILEGPRLSDIRFTTIEKIDITREYDILRNGSVEIVNSDIVISNSIFRNNFGKNGGALAIDQSHSVICNNIFSNNFAAGFGGAFLSSASSNKIINNVFHKNTSNNYAGGLLLFSPVMDSIQNNIFYGNTNTTGDSSIATYQADSHHFVAFYNFLQDGHNPAFVSVVDFHLSSTSPCSNAGNPAARYNDTDGTRNDMGAYGGPLGNW